MEEAMTGLDWQEDAACREHWAELWFPELEPDAEEEPRSHHGAWAEAREICAGCTVRDECLQYAIENGMGAGMWGGATYGERKRLRRSA